MEIDNKAGSKRLRDEAASQENDENKVKAQKAVQNKDDTEEKESTKATLGPKNFVSSVQMFDYFYKFLHFWSPNVNINKFEHMVLLDLIKKGHLEPDQKIGEGVCAFQVRYHPQFQSRCFFLVREDGSVDDFSFRKCVNRILPLPENMLVNHDVNKALSKGKGGGRGRGGGRGSGGRPRN